MTRPINYTRGSGFTLIELLFSLAFVGFILIFVLSATIEVMGDYNKGIALKQINQASRSIIQDMSDVIKAGDSTTSNLSALNSGRACFDSVSFIWNIRSSTANQYTNGQPVSFVRVQDSSGALCVASSGKYPNIDPSFAVNLISSPVWVQSVNVMSSNDKAISTISLSLSTSSSNQPTVPSANGLICAGGHAADFCAVASFTTSVTARNIGG